MNNEKEIPFGAFDSELMHQEIFIPEGFEATIDGNKIILTRIENEDEKIRKALIEYFNEQCDMSDWNGVYGYQVVAWLEKQGEHKKFRDSIQVGDEVTRNSDGVIVNLSQLNRVAKKDEKQSETFTKKDVDDAYVEGMAFAKNELEKQGEQKSTYKPKFKDGDWVVCEVTDSVSQIKINHKYGYDLTNGGYICSDEVDHYHLWTIQDAKDGDVLANCNIICIYKKRESEHLIKVYLNYSLAEGVEITDDTIGDFNLYPATKEQRDTLFTKMKEAGYEWDAEKKELKKVEKKSQRMISAEAKEAMYDKPTDEDMKEALRTEYEKGRADAIAEMQKEWSDKEKQMYADIIEATKKSGVFKEAYKRELVDFLNSLKERYAWKPSDKQIRALEYIIDNAHNTSYSCKIAKELLEQLKKLKGE